jgi:DNA replication protein DnaC
VRGPAYFHWGGPSHAEASHLGSTARFATDRHVESPSRAGETLPGIEQLGFLERLALLLDREITERDNRRLTPRLRSAKLKQAATLEDLDFHTPRQLDRALVRSLATCDWVKAPLNLPITGPTGGGKSYLACALAQKACREGYTAFYPRRPRLFVDLEIARGDGRYPKLMRQLARVDVPILDDFGLEPLSDRHRRDLLELFEDRYAARSTIMTSQLPSNLWHDAIGDPTLADATLDRLVHNAHRLELKGPSLRKSKRGNPKAGLGNDTAEG